MRRNHWTFGTTADVGLGATAPEPEALFGEMALGLFSLMTDLHRVRPRDLRTIKVRSYSPESLLVGFLGELLFLHETEGWVFRRFEVRLTGTPPTRLRAEAWGEPWEEGRHVRKVMVKAITLHRLELDLKAGRARAIVDI